MAKVIPKTESDRKPRLTLMTLTDLAATPVTPRWLVKDVLVRDQPCVIGGPPKSLKTSLGLDLAVSLATATPFLNRFTVHKKCRVAVFSGESGRPVIHETIRRILRSKTVTEPDDRLLRCGFRLPRLSVPADRIELRKLLAGEGTEVVVIDPLYLCLLAGGKALSAANLYDVGAVLAATADACRRAGATLVLVHHTTKASTGHTRPTTLADLAFAGVGEFARQWLLVNRAAEYRPGSHQHQLVLSVGGSAGHSSRWRVAVDERPDTAKQRTWSVAVTPDDADRPCRSKATRWSEGE